jgi:hypothetical protein
MSTAAMNWLLGTASGLGALGIIWAALRRIVGALVDASRLVKQILELQPRVVELGERLVVLVDDHNQASARLDRIEAVVFPDPLRKDSHV